jgi:CBS domain-containing protein
MRVSDWIDSHPALPVTVTPDEPMEQVAATFLSQAGLRDLYIVTPEDRLLGSIRHIRLAKTLLAEQQPVQTTHQIMERISGGVAKEIMERDIVTARPEEELDNVLYRMLEYEVEDMPVVDDADKIVGNINLTEVLRATLNGEL